MKTKKKRKKKRQKAKTIVGIFLVGHECVLVWALFWTAGANKKKKIENCGCA